VREPLLKLAGYPKRSDSLEAVAVAIVPERKLSGEFAALEPPVPPWIHGKRLYASGNRKPRDGEQRQVPEGRAV